MERIDIYLKTGSRWQYIEGTRGFATLAEAARWAAGFYGQPAKARWSER